MADNTKLYNLKIYTPSNTFFNAEVESVTVPSVQGHFQVLFNHAPIMAKIDTGIVVIKDGNGTEHKIEVTNGFAELKHNDLTIAVSAATFL